MMQSVRSSVNMWELIGIRGGMSIYAGWLTAATALNSITAFKVAGMSDSQEYSLSNMFEGLMFMDEEAWGITLLSMLVVIYGGLTYYVSNPLYDLVYNYVLSGIYWNVLNDPSKAPYADLISAMPILLGLHFGIVTVPMTAISIIDMGDAALSLAPGLLNNIS